VVAAPPELARPQAPEASDHTEKGLALARAGDLDAAEKELRQSVELAPNAPQALGALGSILAMRGHFEESNRYLARALALMPGDAATRRNLARNQWKLGQFREAQGNLERVLKANPRDAQATFLLGMVAESEHDHPRAARLLSSVPDLVRSQPLAVAGLASAYYHVGNRDKARMAFDWLPVHAADPQATFVAARVASEGGDYEIAEKLLSSIRGVYPDPSALDFNLALAQYHQNRFAEGERILAGLEASGRTSGPVFNLLGWCREKQGKRDGAIQALTKAIEQESANEQHYLDLAGILATSTRRLAAALAIAAEAAQRFPSSYQVWLSKGMIETKLQQYVDAIQSYQKVVKLKPDLAEPRRELAMAQWLNGERTVAVQCFEQLLQGFPQDALNYEAYGTTLLDSAADPEMTRRGIELLRRAIALDPSRAEAHYYLGNAALAQGNAKEALAHLQTAVKLDPHSSRVHFALSRALKRAGHSPESGQELDTYTRLKREEEELEQR
jgi:tetratricopeptide (TPR) repeat protein